MALELFFYPFRGIDSIVEILIIIVSLIISLFSNRVYKIIKDKNYRYFSLGFLLIAVSFVFKILSNITILNRVRIEKANFIFTITSQLHSMQLINFFSFIFYKTLNILGFLIIFLIITKSEKKERVFLFLYLSIISVLFSIYFNFVFYITLVLIMAFLTIHFYDNYKKKKLTNTLLVFLGFLILLFGHLFFIFSEIHPLFYLSGEILQLIGFSFLLFNQIKIMRYRKVK